MSAQSRWVRAGTLTLIALALSGCGVPIRVNSYVESGADLSHYHRYDFAPVDAVPTGDPRLDSNPFFVARVQEAVEQQLAARGFERTTSGTPSLRVHFHASVTQNVLDVNEIDRQNGYCAQSDCRPFVYEAGTLIIDLVDADTNKLVWRGWAESGIDALIDNQEWMEQKIDEAVAKIVAKIPRHS